MAFLLVSLSSTIPRCDLRHKCRRAHTCQDDQRVTSTGDHRAVERNALVLGVFRATGRNRGGHRITAVMDRGPTVGPHPPQLGPLVG